MIAAPHVYSVTEKEYQAMLTFFKVMSIAGGTVAIAGLAGIVANTFIDPETSKTLKEFAPYAVPTAIAGVFFAAYGGINYFGNKSLNKAKPLK